MPSITRRDFLNGMALVIGTGVALRPMDALALISQSNPRPAPHQLITDYPPALTGLRGAHPGSFESAHALAWGGGNNPSQLAAPVEKYDLIVVGAGISGLSAAYYYRTRINPNAKILILDNHDDFGGHAKRNEFSIGGKTYLSYGGSQSLDSPEEYSATAHQLLQSLGINLIKLEESYDETFFTRHQLTCGIFLDQSSFGRTSLIPSALPTQQKASYYTRQWVPGLVTPPEFMTTLGKHALTSAQQSKLREVHAVTAKARRYFQGQSGEKRFYSQTYVQFLRTVYQIKDESLLKLLSMPLAEDYALGGNGISLPVAAQAGLLGLPPAKALAALFEDKELLPEEDGPEDESYVYHFPDGNATLTRLLVHRLIPSVARFHSAEECLTARFDYKELDRPRQAVQIRLSSTAVHIENRHGGTAVRYIRNGQHYEAQSRHTIMAGWHMMAAHIIPSLPAAQKEAMRANIKMPLVYAQVALHRWEFIKKSGIAATYCPGACFQFTQLDFPVEMGKYQPDRSPDKPVILLMIRMPCPAFGDGGEPDLLRQGRAELLASDFDTFEKKIIQQLTEMYGSSGFSAEQDIAAITVNRWPHGFTYDEAEYQGQPAHKLSGRRHGNIVMANADSTGRAYADGAIDAAWSAVESLINKP